MSKGNFFSGLVQGLGGSIAQMHQQKTARDYEDKMTRLNILLSASKDPNMLNSVRRGVLREAFGTMGKGYEGLADLIVQNQEVDTGRKVNGEVVETDVDEPTIDPRAIKIPTVSQPQGRGPMVQPDGTLPPMPTPTDAHDAAMQDRAGMQQQSPFSGSLFGGGEGPSPVTTAATGGMSANPSQAEVAVEQARKILRIMPQRPKMMQSDDMSPAMIEEARQRRLMQEQRGYQREDARFESGLRTEEAVNTARALSPIRVEEAGKLAGKQPFGGVRVDPNTGQRQLPLRNPITGETQVVQMPGVSEEVYETNARMDRGAQMEAMAPLMREAVVLRAANPGMSMSDALNAAGQKMQAAGVMDETMKMAQYENIMSEITYRSRMRAEAGEGREKEDRAARQQAYQSTVLPHLTAARVAIQKAISMKGKMAILPEEKQAIADMESEAKALQQAAVDAAVNFASDYAGVTVSMGPNGLPVVQLAPISGTATRGTASPALRGGASAGGGGGNTTTLRELRQISKDTGIPILKLIENAKANKYTITDANEL